jgi:hypothetical protein
VKLRWVFRNKALSISFLDEGFSLSGVKLKLLFSICAIFNGDPKLFN